MLQYAFVISVTLIVTTVHATNVLECESTPIDIEGKVHISKCEEPPCKLKRKTETEVRLGFSPDHDIDTLKTSVHAEIASIPVPFFGVDGKSACENIFMSDGKTKANCPLKKGENYLYVNNFKVLQQYPKIKTLIHWALTDSNDEVVSCFEVPARITD